MKSTNLRAVLLWGVVLWLIGYVLGILLFPVVPSTHIGWVIMPIGIITTIWVLLKKISVSSMQEYLAVGVSWAIIAILCDYLFLVLLFRPTDGYYKLDVYCYYALMVLLPIGLGWWKTYRTPS